MLERHSPEWREALTFAYLAGVPLDQIAKVFGCSLSYPGYLAKRKGHPCAAPARLGSGRRKAANAGG